MSPRWYLMFGASQGGCWSRRINAVKNTRWLMIFHHTTTTIATVATTGFSIRFFWRLCGVVVFAGRVVLHLPTLLLSKRLGSRGTRVGMGNGMFVVGHFLSMRRWGRCGCGWMVATKRVGDGGTIGYIIIITIVVFFGIPFFTFHTTVNPDNNIV